MRMKLPGCNEQEREREAAASRCCTTHGSTLKLMVKPSPAAFEGDLTCRALAAKTSRRSELHKCKCQEGARPTSKVFAGSILLSRSSSCAYHAANTGKQRYGCSSAACSVKIQSGRDSKIEFGKPRWSCPL